MGLMTSFALNPDGKSDLGTRAEDLTRGKSGIRYNFSVGKLGIKFSDLFLDCRDLIILVLDSQPPQAQQIFGSSKKIIPLDY